MIYGFSGFPLKNPGGAAAWTPPLRLRYCPVYCKVEIVLGTIRCLQRLFTNAF